MSKIQNIFIIPFTTEDEYDKNTKDILSFLKENVLSDSVILTEGHYSYTSKRHDVFDYSKYYDFRHENSFFLVRSIELLKSLRYIVNIGTWTTDIVGYDFASNNPDITIIYIAGPLTKNYHRCDKVEDLSIFEYTATELKNILLSQFHKN